jgi:hypothetical protein
MASLKKAAVKIGKALGKAHGKAIKVQKAAAKKAKAVGKELVQSKKHLVRAYEEAKG